MGMILEQEGQEDKALKFYHASLRYAVKYQRACKRKNKDAELDESGGSSATKGSKKKNEEKDWLDIDNSAIDEPFSLKEVRPAKSTSVIGNSSSAHVAPSENTAEEGEMELILEKRFDRWALSENEAVKSSEATKFYYDELFTAPAAKTTTASSRSNVPPQQSHLSKQGGEGPNVDIAMTLHQIGQIHRRSHRYPAALSAYGASLRGMKKVFGTQHGNIAAVLGNIANLYMETGDYDKAFDIYQEVLGIETLHLGLSHPEVAVTLHNIATIECNRGNEENGVSLYKQVVDMQKIRYGNEHLTVAVTLSCLADAFEKLRDITSAMKTYEEALNIRIAVLGPSHLDVGRLLHKLGQLALSQHEHSVADDYFARADEIYAANNLFNDHEFVREILRDKADIRAVLAFKQGG